MKAKRISAQQAEENDSKLKTLQTSLDEAYDIIDELEFELESVGFWV